MWKALKIVLKSRREQSQMKCPLFRDLVVGQPKFHQKDRGSLSMGITHGVGL